MKRDPVEAKNLWPGGAAPTVRHEMVRKLIAKMKELKEEPSLIEAVRAGVR